MSRPNQLPPRCPIPKSYSTQDPTFEDQPASDSVVLLGNISANFSGFNQSEYEESLNSEASGDLELKLEPVCVYGPNSPRTRNNNSSFCSNQIASAFSDYDSDDIVVENPCGYISVPNAKKNPGQRSRIRKLQYIAELERTVSIFQTVEADLSVRVASLLQVRATLSLENSQLKQQMAILKQDKFIREGEYQLLKKEAQRLGNLMRNNSNNLARSYSAGSNIAPRTGYSHLDWKLLDLTKLNLN